jgi:hypothetical protein
MSESLPSETLYITIFNKIQGILEKLSRSSISRTEAQEEIAAILNDVFREFNVTIGISQSNVISLRSRPIPNSEPGADEHWDIQCRLVADYFIENGFDPSRVEIRDDGKVILLKHE